MAENPPNCEWGDFSSSPPRYSTIPKRRCSGARALKAAIGFALLRNSYKPYACGVVLHPIIDGCLAVREAGTTSASQVARIDLKVNPLVLELTGKKEPQTGLKAKFSVYHAAA